MHPFGTVRPHSHPTVMHMNSLIRLSSMGVFALFAALSFVGPAISSSSASSSPAPQLVEPEAVNYSYRDYTQIKDDLLGIEGQHSDISKVYDIGDSYEKVVGSADRDILAIKISDNVQVDEDEPEVLVVGLHHAREWSTSELVLELADNLTDEYGNDTRISWLVDNREIWIVPVVNPDGLDYSLAHDQWWRKNRHVNPDGSYGVDLNRNYAGSMNGDPAGDWGGAGASHVPSDEVYCGPAPFSEPETQAIMNLVLSHDFEIAIDFHSYSQLVLWPWGYAGNVTPDDADLVRIGNSFAALNGYTAEQSIGLYPTTGDSIDWLYGGMDIYAFCFEVGLEFHPAKTADVLSIIGNNLPPAILGIELAGDREERPFQISHSPVASRAYSPIGFGLAAGITAARGVDTDGLALRFRVDGGAWSEVPMALLSGNDTYGGIVPSQPTGSHVEYYFVAHDVSGVEIMAPRYAPYEVHSFEVTPGDPGNPLEVEFAPPGSIDGSLATVVTAAARNVSPGSELVFHMRDGSPGTWSNITMAESAPNSYTCTVPALMPLGDYEIHLTVESGGVVEWTSPVTALSLRDETAPVVWAHSSTQTATAELLLEVNVSDAYGVESVVARYGERGSPSTSSEAMTLIAGSAANGTWSARVTILSSSTIEYNFTAQDTNQSSRDPADGGTHEFVPVVVSEFPFAAVLLVSAAVLLSVAALSRARRS